MGKLYVSIGWLLFLSVSIVLVLLQENTRFDRSNIFESTDYLREWQLVVIVGLAFKLLRFTINLSKTRLPSLVVSNTKWGSTLLFGAIILLVDITIFLASKEIFKLSEKSFISLNSIKIVTISGALLYKISFDDKLNLNASRLNHLLTNVGFFCLAVGEIFYIISESSTGTESVAFYDIFVILTSISLGAFALASYFLVTSLWLEITHWTFGCNRLKSSFLLSILLLLFSTSSVVLQLTVSIDDFAFAMVLFQILLIFYLDFHQDHCFQTKMREKEVQLETRLDMMRYISHEMRTPLNTAVLGLNSLLDGSLKIKLVFDAVNILVLKRKRDSLDTAIVNQQLEIIEKIFSVKDIEEQLDTIKQVRNSCTVAVGTLDDILIIDKLEAGKLQTELKNINPWHFIKTESQPFYLNAREKKISLKLECVDHDSRWYKTNLIQGDAFKLGQVIRNLLSNALKFTPFEGIVLVKMEMVPFEVILESKEISLDQNATKKEFGVRISIKDSGAGISKENQDKLFGRYIQINPGELQQGKGSGLGLWISKKIIELHGGWIYVISDGEGTGSTFIIELPLITPQANSMNMLQSFYRSARNTNIESSNAESSFLSEGSGFSRQTAKNRPMNVLNGLLPNKISPIPDDQLNLISPLGRTNNSTPHESFNSFWDSKLNFLVVDDSLMSCKFLKKALERFGHHAITAGDGQECVEIIQKLINHENGEEVREAVEASQQQNEMQNVDIESGVARKDDMMIDVILIDDNMPRLSGVEATKRLRDMGFEGLIYGVTGDVEAEKRQAFMDNGANEVLPKPLDMQKLKMLVNLKQKK